MGEESPCSSQIPMGIPPGSGDTRGCLSFFCEHCSVLFFPPSKVCVPYARICWLFYLHQKRCNLSQCPCCGVGTVERKQSFGCPFDMGQTPLMGNDSKMGGNCSHNRPFPVAHGSHGKMGSKESG